MDCDHQQQEPSSLRRSQRLKNKLNANGGSLSGDKHRLFTYDFHHDHKQRNSNSNNRFRNQHIDSTYPIISRCKRKLKFVHHSPNVFVIDNFLTDNEINHLLNIVTNNESKFEVSYTQSTGTDQIYSEERTSTFIFLQKYMDKISRTIERRAADIVSIPIENVEPLQLVRYTKGQEFTLHHDAGTLINESRKKKSSSSLLSNASKHSLASAYSMDFVHDTQIYQNIANGVHPNCNRNNSHVAQQNQPFIGNKQSNLIHMQAHIPFPAQINQNQPQQLTSAQYALRYQQWQQKLQQMSVGQKPPQKLTTSCRPQSCPPVFKHCNINDDESDSGDEQLTKEELEEKYGDYRVEIVAPVRVFSFFVYLTTLPEGCGGETYFPKIGLKVRPERGKAVLWCNVNPSDISKGDPMLIHRALPVKDDRIKIGMNIWINATKFDSSYRW